MEQIINTPDTYLQYLKDNTPLPTKSNGNLNLPEFFKLMFHTIKIANPNIVFAPAWPQYIMPDSDDYKRTMDDPIKNFKETITYLVIREEPASTGGSKQPFSGDNRQLTPKYREVTIKSKTECIEIAAQSFDSFVQFDVWALTSFEVDQLVFWFKSFMKEYRDFFKQMGLQEIYFNWRGRDSVSSQIKNKLHVRSLVYYIKTEEFSSKNENMLNELKVQIIDRINQGGL